MKELVLCYAQIAAGLEAMHAKGIIHQDVRWDNMLGNESETVWKMCDLGSSARNKVHGKANVTAAEDCQ